MKLEQIPVLALATPAQSAMLSGNASVLLREIAERLQQLLEGGQTASREQIMQVLQNHFRPEFLNRIDEVVIFHKLGKEHLKQIVGIQLRRVTHLLAERGYHLNVAESAEEYLAEIGFEPAYGARPLKRAIQHELQDPLAMKILAGDFKEGATILVEGGEHSLKFSQTA